MTSSPRKNGARRLACARHTLEGSAQITAWHAASVREHALEIVYACTRSVSGMSETYSGLMRVALIARTTSSLRAQSLHLAAVLRGEIREHRAPASAADDGDLRVTPEILLRHAAPVSRASPSAWPRARARNPSGDCGSSKDCSCPRSKPRPRPWRARRASWNMPSCLTPSSIQRSASPDLQLLRQDAARPRSASALSSRMVVLDRTAANSAIGSERCSSERRRKRKRSSSGYLLRSASKNANATRCEVSTVFSR